LCDRDDELRGRLARDLVEWLARCERLPLVRAWLPFADFPDPPLDLLAASAEGTIAPRASISVPDSTHFRNEFLMHCSAARPANVAIYISQASWPLLSEG
jgi:hypothetical protein